MFNFNFNFMKNLFLTAFAVLAFCNVGFAKSNVKNVIVIKSKLLADVKLTPCQNMAIDLYICSGSDSVSYFQQLWARCK